MTWDVDAKTNHKVNQPLQHHHLLVTKLLVRDRLLTTTFKNQSEKLLRSTTTKDNFTEGKVRTLKGTINVPFFIFTI